MRYPEDLRYHVEDMWAKLEPDGRVRIGITDFAQDQLGDIVYVDVPSTGQELVVGQVFGAIESTKTVSDLHAPITGSVVEVNHALVDDPEVVNEDAYGRGWIAMVEPSGSLNDDQTMDAKAYRAKVEGA